MAGWSGRENEMQAHTPPRDGGMNNGNQEAAKVVMTFAKFCSDNGLVHDADVEGHIHAGLRCKPTTKTFARFYDRRLRELQDARDHARSLYRAAIERGEIVEPARKTTEEIAQGDPSMPSTKAAIRLLAKRAARLQGDAP